MGPQATSTEAQTNNLAGPIEGGVTAGVLVTLGVLIVIFVYLHRKGKTIYNALFCQFDAIIPLDALNQNDIG